MTVGRAHIAGFLVLGLLLSGCTGSEPTVASSTTVPATTSTSLLPEASGRAYDVLELASHPNGAQLVVDRVEVLSDSTVVSAHLINGSLFELRLGSGETRLLMSDGGTVGLVGEFPVTRVPPAGEVDLVLRFGPVSGEGPLTLQFNQGGGSSPSSRASNAPSFELGPIELDADGSRPDLPPPVAVATSTSTTSGIELVVEGVNFTDTRIGVLARISNPTDVEARIAPTAVPCVLVDDLGNIYSLVLPEGEGFLSVPAGEAVAGTLVFGGRIHPDTSLLTVALNAGGGSNLSVGGRVLPELIIKEIPLSGTAGLAPLPESLEVGETSKHPAGVDVTVDSISFNPTGVEVSVTIANGRDDSVSLAAAGALAGDDVGSTYRLVPLADNPELVVDGNTTVEATLGFSGRIDDAAAELTVVFNANGSVSDPATRQPSFVFGPFQLVRGEESSEPVTAQVFPVGERTRIGPAELVVSQVDRITETLREFDATEVDGGFRLTLPESILFDFGSADLRSDAGPALDLIAEVLAFYSDAEVIVVGHTDSLGSDAANQQLSERRAQSVVDVLVSEHGIALDRLSAEGRGETEPVSENTNPDGSDNPEGRQANRRVEIVVLTDEPVELP